MLAILPPLRHRRVLNDHRLHEIAMGARRSTILSIGAARCQIASTSIEIKNRNAANMMVTENTKPII